VLFRLNI